MSPGTRPSVPRTSGRVAPWSTPTRTPSAPGNVPKRLSNGRFSFTRNTMFLMGVVVMNDDASTEVTGSDELVGVAEMSGGEVDASGVDRSVHATATISDAATTRKGTRRTASSLRRRRVPDRPVAVGAQGLRVGRRWRLREVHRVAQPIGDPVPSREERPQRPVVLDEAQHAGELVRRVVDVAG